MPTTTLQVYPTADGTRFRCTCPWKHQPALVTRGSVEDVSEAMTTHLALDHGWKVVGVQILGSVIPAVPDPNPGESGVSPSQKPGGEK